MDVPLQNEKQISNGPIVALPDDTTMQATHSGILNIPQLPLKAKIAYKFPSIKKSLVSISDLCNEGGSATFTKHNVYIYYNCKIILKGFRDKTTGLWLLPLSLNHDQAMNYNPSHKPATINAASAVLETTHSKQELVRFLYATCFYPVKST